MSKIKLISYANFRILCSFMFAKKENFLRYTKFSVVFFISVNII